MKAENWNNRFFAGFYDPVTRSVVSSYMCGSDVDDCKTDIIEFLATGVPAHLLVVVTHNSYYHTPDDDFTKAFEACGGSDMFDSGMDDYWDQKQYILVGQCGAGLGAGYSASVGLEGKQGYNYWPLELQADPFTYFDLAMAPSPSPAGDVEYVYDERVTAYVSTINRLNGTTAGGTTVVINGTGFIPNATTVYLAGVKCATEYAEIGSYREQHLCEWDGVDCLGLGVSEDSIVCLTNKWDFSGDAFEREVEVNVGDYGTAVTAPGVSWSYMNLWSATTTWGGDDPPAEGDSVVITYGGLGLGARVGLLG